MLPLDTSYSAVPDRDYTMAKNVATVLHKHYPGHLWAVSAQSDQGIITIYDLYLSGKWGFVCHIADSQNDPNMKDIVRAGGELLERYNMARGKFKEQALTDLPVDFSGNHIVEH
jgi:hypothetical protein